ncbi:hypothetical protein OU789_16725 [Halocynthiibacter sp. C4]|uniref:hypothetical protein n=1 Tax=Halocynthiibacter sp. C4 TaxID=2992758 RepID=UPI00237AC761|nr:hypothetical protein [Halocynthiibacter sp. C4]MDE0591585.1 hypothetical protein [Halocynthiibacter sp. C4]
MARQALVNQMIGDGARMITKGEGAPKHPSTFLAFDDLCDNETEEGTIGCDVELPTFVALLGGLENAATRGKGRTSKLPTGKIPDYALMLWFSNIEKLWCEISSDPFSRDITSTGEPITNASRFCVLAFQKIDPNYTESRILNGMKKFITKRRKEATGKLREKMTP